MFQQQEAHMQRAGGTETCKYEEQLATQLRKRGLPGREELRPHRQLKTTYAKKRELHPLSYEESLKDFRLGPNTIRFTFGTTGEVK